MLKLLNALESTQAIAKQLGVGEVTVGAWKNLHLDYSSGDLTTDDCLKNRKNTRKCL